MIEFDALKHQWSFEKSMHDLVSGTKMTFANNHVELKSDRYNVSMAAIDFDGTTDSYASLPPGAYFGKEFSFSFWVFVKEIAPYQRMLDFGDDISINNMHFFFGSSNLKLTFVAYQQDKTECLNIYSDKAINLKEWAHLAFTYENQNAKIYLNGELVANGQANHADCCTWNTQTNYIGKGIMTDRNGNLMISTFKIFNRSLNVDEILLHQKPLEVIELNP